MHQRTVTCRTCLSEFVITNSRSRQVFCSVKCRPGRKQIYYVDQTCVICTSVFTPKYECQRYCSYDCRCKGISITRKKRYAKEFLVCLTCKHDFIPNKQGKKYCSHACFGKRYSAVTKQCLTCKKDFTVVYRFRGQKNCSKECRSKASKSRSTKVEKSCLACNSVFYAVQSYKDKAKYCCIKCFYEHTYQRESSIVELTCENCKKRFNKPFTQRSRRFCGYVCANSGENNNQFGKRGKETSMFGRKAWNNGLTKETDERIRSLGEKISIVISNKIVNGDCNHIGFKGEHYTGKKNGKITRWLRSTYESICARMLDADQTISSWIHEPMRIPYKFNGSIHNYVPDFLITTIYNEKILIEVKPKLLSETTNNLAKFSAAREWCSKNDIQFVIISEHELGIK